LLNDGQPGTPQIPVDLPTFDEVVGSQVAPGAFNDYLLRQFAPSKLNVYTVHAEVEGIVMAESFRHLLTLAKSRDVQFLPLGNLLPPSLKSLPQGHLVRGVLQGREGWLGVQQP
jgi:undecaprenyl phosphate-alpha-L-ara4FN deformylase